MAKTAKILGGLLAAVLVFVLVAAGAVYFWPHTSAHRQTGVVDSVTYDAALERVEDKIGEDQANNVTEECRSTLLTHGERTAHTVVFLHGVRQCPHQFEDITRYFYEQGYNVYAPVAPAHGTADPLYHANVTADGLVDFVNDAVTTATGLGEEVGVVGLSGGGMLSTWAAEYRPEVEHALLLSPFYEPAPSQSPKWQLPLLKTLHGNHLIGDEFSNGVEAENPGFSYRALAQYLIVGDNLKKEPTNLGLESIAVVVAEDDELIDHELAHDIPAEIARDNGLELLSAEIPAQWEIGHEITGMNVEGYQEHRDVLFDLYVNLYEGRPVELVGAR
ncbi:alpha/beta fold hydrolase [Corynebacterium guangdongense]|uniref:Carboxylesterase n=1 Tax=Corynebacterium guangdongense TaxID=1783348 RepID=A0ABU1ZVR2_9CORY|nr:alpha/beta fold hydrolase [Corynebacterium guangdongense]MDR7328850.1 carboxylesterase [Corynebacterium guangdongense]WJZ17425.1 Alpha/beta hydrolase family protein [Corynebacterium guangdongense]